MKLFSLQKSTYNFLSVLVLCCILNTTWGQDPLNYTLDNGLQVVLDVRENDKHVFGSLVVNVGSADERLDATGMAHYLEHMLFKGTTDLGTVDWEKEKVHYEKIIALYDDLQNATTPEEIKAINKKINDETKAQSQYIISNEFSAAIQQMGGQFLNASTGFERTNYFNLFPSNQIEKWLSIYAHRIQNPVFRLFQTELETVYEERNVYQDSPFTNFIYRSREIVYGEDKPYARPIIGLTAHLKKPWMSAMIEFFEQWYVPNNMAIILSGKFDVEKVKPLIEKYFGGFQSKPLPERKLDLVAIPPKKVKEKVNLTPFTIGLKHYVLPLQAQIKDVATADIISNLLTNKFQTGFLDKLTVDGDVISASGFIDQSRVANILQIQYIPKFDINQLRQESLSFTEKMILEAVEKIKSGDFDEERLENIKTGIIQNLEDYFTTTSGRVLLYTELYVLGRPMDYYKSYMETLKTIDKKSVTALAQKYLTKNDITVHSDIERKKKTETIQKPQLDPITFSSNEHSPYLDSWMRSQTGSEPFEIFDPKSIQNSIFQDKIQLHHLENKNNELFQLTIRFHAGNDKYPKLKYAVELLNNAGVLSQYSSDEFKNAMGNLNVSYEFSSTQNYTYITLEGYDQKLASACQLISRMMLIPEITEKSLNGIIGRVLNGRQIEKKTIDTTRDALAEYLVYDQKSEYIERLKDSDIISLAPSELTGIFNEAILHKADIFYYGTLKSSELTRVLKENLAFGANRKDPVPVVRKPYRKVSENTIYLVNEPKISQAHIYIFLDSDPVALTDIPKIKAFNEYFSGGFNGLMMKEIRENRALAYTAVARIEIPLKRDWTASFSAYVGTQPDKTIEAVEVLAGLLTDLPEYPDRMDGIKAYLSNGTEIANEQRSSYLLDVARWKTMGYSGNPKTIEKSGIQALSFEDLRQVYKERIQEKKYAIAILGDFSKIDTDDLKAFGKIIKINKNDLFSKRK